MKQFKIYFALILLFICSVIHSAALEIKTDKVMSVKVNDYTVLRANAITSGGIDLLAGEGNLISDTKQNSVWTNVREWKNNHGKITRTMIIKDNSVKYIFDYISNTRKPIDFFIHMPAMAMDIPRDKVPVGVFKNYLTLNTIGGKMVLNTTESDGNWIFEDFRHAVWCNSFRIHCISTAQKGKIVITAAFSPEKPDIFVTFPLLNANTRPYADDKNGSGWTGQGPANDMSNLLKGDLYCAGIPFSLPGRAVLLNAIPVNHFPETSGVMKLSKPEKLEMFYFLQTAAWSAPNGTVIAKYIINYADGSNAVIPVRYLYDVADWWQNLDVVNAKVAWQGTNRSGQPICIYMSRAVNPNPDKAVISVELVSTKSPCILAMLGVTALKKDAASAKVKQYLDESFKFNKNQTQNTQNYVECPLAWNGTIEEGSALDFSSLNHKPAGKYGYLKRVGDHFEFEKRPGEKVRFWGTNFAIEGPFPDKDLAPGIAKTMAAQGVNMVRFHLYAARECLLQAPNGKMNPEMLDKMFFLFAELKKNGIYVYMDINDGICYDWMLQREKVLGTQERLKEYSMFADDLIEATKLFARTLFTTKNPYTGMSFAEDPAVAAYEIINEYSFLKESSLSWDERFSDKVRFLQPQFKEKYKKNLTDLWNNWLKDNNLSARPLPKTFNVDPISRKFAIEMDRRYNRIFIEELRNMGVKVPICGMNWMITNSNLAVAEQDTDFIGNHDYWTLPIFGNPLRYSNNISLSTSAWKSPLVSNGWLGTASLKNLPVIHGEWNFCYPNANRCEAMPTTAAIAAYQDWDGMIFYGATGSCDDGKWNRFRENPAIMVHSQQTDPSTWGAGYFGVSMFRRGDVATAKKEISLVMPNSARYEKDMPLLSAPYLLELGKVSLEFNGNGNKLFELISCKNLPDQQFESVIAYLKAQNTNQKQVVSDTKELIRLPEHPLFIVNTPLTQCVTGRLCNLTQAKFQMSNFHVISPMDWATFGAISLDGKNLEKSERILLIAVGNSANTDEKLENSQVISMGKAPVKTEPFLADVTYLTDSSDISVYALDPLTGKREYKLDIVAVKNGITFNLDGTNATIYYELVREKQSTGVNVSLEESSLNELFSSFDTTANPLLQQSVELWNNGKKDEAIKVAADYFRNRNKTVDIEEHEFYAKVGNADDIVDGKVIVVDRPYHFKDGKIDFHFNPTVENKPFNPEWTWQFNRHHIWDILADKYLETFNSRYAKCFTSQFLDWFNQCPPPKRLKVDTNTVGSAWRTIDTGIRLGATWPKAWNTFIKSPEFTDRTMMLFLASALRQAKHLYANKTGGNWVTYEMKGLYCFSVLFPEFKESKTFRSDAINAVYNLVNARVLPDGAHDELTTSYHCGVIYNLLKLIQIGEQVGLQDEFPQKYLDLAEKGLEYALSMMTPDGYIPLVNDSGKDNVEKMVAEFAYLFPNNKNFAFIAENRPQDKRPEYTSIFHPYAGYAVMRSSWGKDANYLCFDVGPLGMSHYHHDKLNISINAGDEELLFDGNASYENSAYRNYSVEAKGHNLPIVDGKGQFRSPEEPLNRKTLEKIKKIMPNDWHWFTLAENRRVFEPIDGSFISNDTIDFAQGYFSDNGKHFPAKHHRQVLFVKPDCFLVVDRLTPYDNQEHLFQLRWHVDTINEEIDSSKIWQSNRGKTYDLVIAPLFASETEVRSIHNQHNPEILGYRVCYPAPGHPATTVLHERKGKGEQTFFTLLMPFKSAEKNPVKKIQRIGKNAVEIVFDNGKILNLQLQEQVNLPPIISGN
ncbi:MAG: alginate lyase family protein [Lentisphaeria bacterium]|nr:alginate lyase family protein [Lentisphaeria bacterium]